MFNIMPGACGRFNLYGAITGLACLEFASGSQGVRDHHEEVSLVERDLRGKEGGRGGLNGVGGVVGGLR